MAIQKLKADQCDLGTFVDDSSIQQVAGKMQLKADGVKDSHLDFGTDAGQISTADLPEQTNLYYTDARVTNRVAAVASAGAVRGHFSAGEGMDIADGVVSGEDATISNKGIASFATDDFAVASGAVTIKADGVSNTQLAGSIASSKIAEINSFDTGDLSEGSNLYYTDARANARVVAHKVHELTAPSASFAMNSQKITGLANAANAQDAVTKSQLDAVIAGLAWEEPVDQILAAGAGLPNSPGTGDRLVTTDANGFAAHDLLQYNGSAWILQTVERGSALLNMANNTAYVRLADNSWGAISAPGAFTYGAALVLNGLNVDVAVDGSGIEIFEDALRLKDDGVTLAKMADLARGKLIVGDAGGNPSDLSKGAEHTVLVAGATDPYYAQLGNDNVANNANIDITKLAQYQISGKNLGSNLSSLTAPAAGGVRMSSFNGSGNGVSDLKLDYRFKSGQVTIGAGGNNSSQSGSAGEMVTTVTVHNGNSVVANNHPNQHAAFVTVNGIAQPLVNKTNSTIDGDEQFKLYASDGNIKMDIRGTGDENEFDGDQLAVFMIPTPVT